MIRMQDFSFKYENSSKNALSDINLEIRDGDFVGIIGNSGAGKTTLTYSISGVVPHYYNGDFYGSVVVNGMDTVETLPETLADSVGSVFQDVDAQMVASVVEDELLFGLENFGVPHEEIEERLVEALEATGIADLRYREIESLSGGQKQKVAVAAIIALRPSIIVLDEPTGELDPQSSEQIFRLLKKLNEDHGTTIVVVEQKIVLLCNYAKRLLLVEDGRIAAQGTVREVLQDAAKMEQIGIHVPRTVSLYEELEKRGLYEGPAPVGLEESKKMVEEVLQ